jgi:hypothetical protein
MILILIISLLINPIYFQRSTHRGTRNAAAIPNLNTNLVSSWKLGEAGTPWEDSIGSNDLAERGGTTPIQVAGKIGNAVEFQSAGGDSIFIADNASLSITSDMTIAFWTRADVLPGATFPGLISKWQAGQQSYTVLYSSSAGTFSFAVSSDGSTNSSVNSSVTPSTGVWYFIVAIFDNAADTISISVTPDSAGSVAAFQSAAFASNIFDGTSDFEMGILVSGNLYDGRIDAANIWNYVVPVGHLNYLFNSNVGREPPFPV